MKLKTATVSLVFAAFFSFSALAYAAPEVVGYKLNGKEESARLNPSLGDVVNIEINTNIPVKFSRIYICKITDSKCNDDDDSSVIFFTTTSNSYASSVKKPWDGKPSDTKMSRGVVVSDGDYKIKVKMKDEVSTEYKYIQELSPYVITVDSNYSGGSGGSSSSASSESSSGSSQSDVPSSSSRANSGISSFISTHSSPEDLSSAVKSSAAFEVSAGRDRLVYVGAPAYFAGEAAIPKGSEGQAVKFIWSFGDGSTGEGKKVSHAYGFAGDYIVVLNASLSDLSAVSRTNVKVANPSLVISNVGGDSVEIWNKGIFEINLGGWIISNSRGKFIFSSDTIIAPNNKIIFPDEHMKLNLAEGGKVSLFNPSQKEISSHYGVAKTDLLTAAVSQNVPSNLDNDPVVMKIRDFIAKTDKESAEKKNNFSESKIAVKSDNEVASDTYTKNRDNARVDSIDEFSKAKEKDLTADNGKIVSSSVQTAAVASSQASGRGLMRSLLNLPSSGFGLVKRLFYSGN